MLKTGFVGWRGMVGSVLMNRMIEENDFCGFEPLFFTTSQAGQKCPDIGIDIPVLQDAYDISKLCQMDIIVTCQGSSYTEKVLPDLRKCGWNGFWIDAASKMRMDKDSIIVLDPVNSEVIDNAISSGIKNFIGGNCTVSLMLMAVGILLKKGLVDWITTMTYQSASGAGAKNMRELLSQMNCIGEKLKNLVDDPQVPILAIDKKVTQTILSSTFPVKNFPAPLAGSAIPFIDKLMDSGQTREEWKGCAETNKILQTTTDKPVPIDGICVRIGAMRCHSQALTIKLNENIDLDEICQMIEESNKWVKIIPNTPDDTAKYLTPAAVAGNLNIALGRIRKLNIGPKYLSAFTVGDQLLWGAAEPIRRIFKIIVLKQTIS